MALLPSLDMFNRNDLSIIKSSQLQLALISINVKGKHLERTGQQSTHFGKGMENSLTANQDEVYAAPGLLSDMQKYRVS